MEKSMVKQTVIQAKQNDLKNLVGYRLHKVKKGETISLRKKNLKRATPHLSLFAWFSRMKHQKKKTSIEIPEKTHSNKL